MQAFTSGLLPGPPGPAQPAPGGRQGAQRGVGGPDGHARRAEAGRGVVWTADALAKMDYALLCAYTHPDCDGPTLDLITTGTCGCSSSTTTSWNSSSTPATCPAPAPTCAAWALHDRARSALAHPDHPRRRAWRPVGAHRASPFGGLRRRFTISTHNLMVESLWSWTTSTWAGSPTHRVHPGAPAGRGAPWSANLVEIAVGAELPDRFAATRPMRVLSTPSPMPYTCATTCSPTSGRSRRRGELERGAGVRAVLRHLDAAGRRAGQRVLTSRMQQFEDTALVSARAAGRARRHARRAARRRGYVKGLQDWQSGGRSARPLQPVHERRRPRRPDRRTGPLAGLAGERAGHLGLRLGRCPGCAAATGSTPTGRTCRSAT